jgi:thiol-disulfide isomerase/thioredoxin
MIQKILRIGIIILLLFIVAFPLYNALKGKKEISDPGTLPDFSFVNVEQEDASFSRDNLKDGTETVIMYFGPDCDHCRALANEIRDQINLFKDVEIIYISNVDQNKILNFRKFFGFEKYHNIHFCRDVDGKFYYYFGDMFVPSTYIYGKDGKLKRYIKAKIQLKDILKELDLDNAS